MGDFKRGHIPPDQLPTEILLGIQNHKLVDRETDAFAGVRELRQLFSEKRRRYAGVVTDIAFDYFLIKHWEQFASVAYQPFIQSCYQGLEQSKDWMPERMQYVVSKMQEHDWLNEYATLDGIDRTINMVSQRIRFKNNMAGAIEEVDANYAQIEAVFMQLFRHLKNQVRDAAIETSR